jgi:hypothetical protein
LATGLLAVSLTGCGLLTLPAELPAILDHVLADFNTFQVSDTWPLEEVTPGTVVDPLGDLDGCWAVYYLIGPPAGAEVELAEVLQFDADAGTLTRTVLHRYGVFGEVTIQRGTYTVIGGDRVTFSVRKVEANVAGRLVDVTAKYDTLPEYTVAATRSGDYLKTRFAMPAGDPRTPAGFLDDTDPAHRHFACPAE